MIRPVQYQQLLIDGAWVDSDSGRTFTAFDPFHDRPVTEASAAGRTDAQQAIRAATRAWPEWAATAPTERRRILTDAARLLEERTDRIANAMLEECGATAGWAAFNVHLGAEVLREAAALVHVGLTGQVIPSDHAGVSSLAIRQPVGVVLAIAPWNAPIILASRAVATPLAFGNAVIFKGSEISPRTHGALMEALHDAGMPPGVIGYLLHHRDDAAAITSQLIADPTIARVNFTGSTHVGRAIAQTSAQHLKRTVLELGGKAPMVVLDDADLDAAASAASFGAFMNAGQICMSTERLIAHRSVAAELTSKVAARAERLIVGDPADPATQIGPMISGVARDRVLDLIGDAVQGGARVLAGGTLQGPSLRPTVVAGVTPEMAIFHEETFAPVIAIINADDDDDAVDLANNTQYGLSAAVFGRDLVRATKVARRIQSGICHINSATVDDEPQMPFGGVKASGWGAFGGSASIEEFTQLRWVTTQEESRSYPI